MRFDVKTLAAVCPLTVGAKNVAWVNCRDCSINRMSAGASLADPAICTLPPSMRNSVRCASSGRVRRMLQKEIRQQSRRGLAQTPQGV